MKKAVIFGAADTGKRIYEDIKDEVEIIAFVDEDERKWGGYIDDIIITQPQMLSQIEFDLIYIGIVTYYEEVRELLRKLEIPSDKIIGRYVEIPTYARIECLKSIKAMLDEEGVTIGAVAELGVFRGDFAKEINKVFCKNKLYLFDTFEGFTEQDCFIELEQGYTQQNRTGYFANTTEQIVMAKMQYPENCCICKGFFPESAKGIDDNFLFVNLDADLYAPTLAGLEFFYPRMVKGGIIFVHDYFSKSFFGAKGAVREFCKKQNISYLPIGDTLSIAIRKD